MRRLRFTFAKLPRLVWAALALVPAWACADPMLATPSPSPLAAPPPPRQAWPVNDATLVVEPLPAPRRLPPIEQELWSPGVMAEPWVEAEVEGPGLPVPAPPPRRNGNPFGGSAPVKIGGFWSPAQRVADQDATLSINEQHADVAFPIWRPSEEGGMWLGIGKFQRLELATDAILPTSGRPAPTQLWNIAAGVMHMRQLSGDRAAGAMVLFGSASDHPFYSARELTVTAMGYYNTPARNERDAWNFGVYYSPVGQIPYPIPGVAYVYRPNEYFTANIGLPSSFNYKPTDTLTIAASYTPLTTFNLLVRQQLAAKFSLYGGYQVMNNGYFLSERAVYAERFYVFDQRVGVGVDRQLGRGFVLDLSGAFLFDRRLFQATTFAGNRTDQLVIDPGVGLTLNLMWAK